MYLATSGCMSRPTCIPASTMGSLARQSRLSSSAKEVDLDLARKKVWLVKVRSKKELLSLHMISKFHLQGPQVRGGGVGGLRGRGRGRQADRSSALWRGRKGLEDDPRPVDDDEDLRPLHIRAQGTTANIETCITGGPLVHTETNVIFSSDM